MLSISTSIGLGSVTLIVTVYVLVLPFSAVTTIFILLSPSETSWLPQPLTEALLSVTEHLTFTDVVLLSALAV